MAKPRTTVIVYAGADRLAHATSPRAAVRSAVKRLVDGEYKKAEIYDETGRRVADASRFYNTITITTKKGVFK